MKKVFILSALCLGLSLTAFSQNTFRIKTYKNKKNIVFQCEKGCSWKDLEINSKKFKIDENGFTNKNGKNSSFCFEVKVSKDKLELTKLKGTTWESLNVQLVKKESDAVVFTD